MNDENASKSLESKLQKLALNEYKHHILLCAGDKCCSSEAGEAAWSYLKKRCQDEDVKAAKVFRTKSACLRICRQGPVALVYPSGDWYVNVDSEVCEKILQSLVNDAPAPKEHLVANSSLFKG